MKLVVAVVHADDAGDLLRQLSQSGLGSTRIKTAGGFLREANATIFVGVEDDQVSLAMNIIRENCTTRRQQVSPIPPTMEPGEMYATYPVEVEVGGATVFVLDVEQFERF